MRANNGVMYAWSNRPQFKEVCGEKNAKFFQSKWAKCIHYLIQHIIIMRLAREKIK